MIWISRWAGCVATTSPKKVTNSWLLCRAAVWRSPGRFADLRPRTETVCRGDSIQIRAALLVRPIRAGVGRDDPELESRFSHPYRTPPHVVADSGRAR